VKFESVTLYVEILHDQRDGPKVMMMMIIVVVVDVGLLGCNAVWPLGAVCSSETSVSVSPHGVTTQKTNIDAFTAVRTSNIMYYYYLK
jgi:hypothetical protein